MILGIKEARLLSIDILKRHHFSEDDAVIITDHLIDAQLSGYTFAGLPRLLVVLERIRSDPTARPGSVKLVSELPTSAVLDGNGNLGYVVCYRAVNIAIEKAKRHGIAIVGAHNSYYSGRSGYYTERAAQQGLIALHASSASRMVAPSGSKEPILGTNPFSVAFPTDNGPVVVDFSTASTMWGELELAARLGETLEDGLAIDQDGLPTTDPKAALLGAVLPWGGHKGYALSLIVQLLGILSGGDPTPEPLGNFGFFFCVWQPDLLMPIETFRSRSSELIRIIKDSQRQIGVAEVMIPGERSSHARHEGRAADLIELQDKVYQDLLNL